MARRIFSIFVAFLMGAATLVFSLSASAEEKVIKLRYSNFFPPAHPNSKLSEAWCKEIEKRTNGRVVISYFPGNTLTPPPQTYDSVVKGIADIGQSLMAYSAGRFPLTGVFGLPLGFTSGYQATRTLNAFYEKFTPAEYGDTQVMYLHGHGPGTIAVRKDVSSLDGIKGLRIKVNAENADIVKALGGAPVSMVITETYDAIKKGVLDGVMLPVETMKGWKFAEVVKTIIINHSMAYTAPIFIVMNKEKWNAISKEDQAAITEINREWAEKQGKLWSQLDLEGEAFAKEKGVKIIKATKEEEAKVGEIMKEILPRYVKEMEAKGLPGDKVLGFCLDFIKNNP